ncbi:MAG: SDR family oxidoreductase [Anaerolineae bacterium]|nr:SDR family oxidoreductase [Anaerolineae bacterium]
MKVAIFGGTGKTGQHLIQQALDAGHQVTALARTPSKLTLQHERLTIMQGDVQDAAKVNEAVKGVDAVISVLGSSPNNPELGVSRGTENIIAGMQKHGVRRLVVSAGAGIGDSNDKPTVIDTAIKTIIRLFSPKAYADMNRVSQVVHACNLDWTIVRVPMLTDDPKTGQVRIGYLGKGVGIRLARADMADFMLRQVGDNTYLRQAPVISN